MNHPTDTRPLTARVSDEIRGTVEWRIQNRVGGGICMSFGARTSINPEREAREWLSEQVKRHPEYFSVYDVVEATFHSNVELLLQECMRRISHQEVLLKGLVEKLAGCRQWPIDDSARVDLDELAARASFALHADDSSLAQFQVDANAAPFDTEDPRCKDGGHACTGCLMAGCCLLATSASTSSTPAASGDELPSSCG